MIYIHDERVNRPVLYAQVLNKSFVYMSVLVVNPRLSPARLGNICASSIRENV